ncbi:bifunctional 23S rRNA (guanine(2069)-N(7))-methyltransferase RlmK/23S rRNA (guanine(2445)-N(2))-methyltransferase RlmL [Aurantivibrio plasticivorans]
MITSSPLFDLFATCPKGLESLLLAEIDALGGQNVRETVAGVSFQGDCTVAYRCCLWSRLANRVLLVLSRSPVDDAQALYRAVDKIEWASHMEPESHLWIDFNGTSQAIRNTQFGSQLVKDAVVDQLRQPDGCRPTINKNSPDIVINVRLHRGQLTIAIDLSGASLHKRGYREFTVEAPMKENLAAGLLIRCQWPALAEQGYGLIDPMCGSGTLLIEAAMMATDTAPGLLRDQFGFERWKQHQPDVWAALRKEAFARHEAGLERPLEEIRGYDENPRAVTATQENSAIAGFEGLIKVMVKPLAEFKRPTHKSLDKGLVLTNPPYGERLGDQESLLPLYQRLGAVLKSEFQGWKAGVFTSNIELAKNMGLRSYKQYKLFNGALASQLLMFDIEPQYFVKDREPGDRGPRLSEGAQMVANRLKKNQKQLAKWLKQSHVSCYRLYDADLPEYAAAIDVYEDHIHVQEYAAPKSVDPKKAEKRFNELQQAVVASCDVSREHIHVKQRRRNKGKQQYEKLGSDPFTDQFTIREGKANFWVNLDSYLDTGIFLDHRPVRQLVAELSLGQRLLNLFCYTATATVQAALGGASSSVSVDMSRTYLRWAEKNFRTNKLSDRHELVQADCLAWLKACREPFDVILLDPPSFSNSKRMDEVLDIQRDHVSLIKRCMELLNPKGTLVFSNNLRSFKLDNEALDKFDVSDITVDTLDKDFQRNSKIHQCFLIRHTS